MTGTGKANAALEVLVVVGSADEAGLRALLADPAIAITGCPGTHEAVARLVHKTFDAVVLYVAGGRQLESVAKLRARAPDVALLALVGRQDRTLCELAIARGASDALALPGLQPLVLQYALRLAVQGMQREREQRTQTLSLRTVFDLDAHPVWVCDPNTLRFLGANRAALETYGYTEAEFAELSVPDLRPRGVAVGPDLPPPGRTAV